MRSCPPPRIAAALGLLLASMPALAAAQDPEPPADLAASAASDPKAVALLGEVAKAYEALGSYRDQGRFVAVKAVDGRELRQESPLRLTLARPAKLALDAGPVKVVSDGETMTTVVGPMRKYLSGPAPKALSLDAFREGPAGALLFGGPSGEPMYILISMLTAPDPAKAVEQLGGALKPAGDDALLIDRREGTDLKLTIDPATKLLKEIELVLSPAGDGPAPLAKLGWAAGEISTAPAEASAFEFKAPEGFSRIMPFQEAAGADAPKEAAAKEE